MKTFLTTIKPASSSLPFVSFQPRSKEGEEKKPEVFASFELPAEIANLHDGMLRSFSIRAFSTYVYDCLKEAIKANKDEFTYSLAEAFAPTSREFLITKKDLEAWIISFASPIIISAIASKAGISPDSVKVIKKAKVYSDLLLEISSRSIMSQENIDACIRVLELISASGKHHPYTDNVAEGLSRKQEKLNEFLAGKTGEDEEEIDF